VGENLSPDFPCVNFPRGLGTVAPEGEHGEGLKGFFNQYNKGGTRSQQQQNE